MVYCSVFDFKGWVDDPTQSWFWEGWEGVERSLKAIDRQRKRLHLQKAAPPGQRSSMKLALHETV